MTAKTENANTILVQGFSDPSFGVMEVVIIGNLLPQIRVPVSTPGPTVLTFWTPFFPDLFTDLLVRFQVFLVSFH